MSRIGYIIVREYLENVRTKAFIIGIVLTPLWFGLVFVVPLLAKSAEVEAQRVVIVDETSSLGADVKEALEAKTSRKGKPLYLVEMREAEGAWEAAGEEPSLVEQRRSEAAEGRIVLLLLTHPVLEKRKVEEGEHEGALLHAATAGMVEAAQVVQTVVNDEVNPALLKELLTPVVYGLRKWFLKEKLSKM